MRQPAPPGEPSAGRPLSSAQERLWSLQRAGLDGAVYVVWIALRISGPLDVAALRGALGGLMARHEALRSAIVADASGRPFQVAREGLAVPLEVADVAEADALAVAEGFLARPFELETAPLARTLLMRLGEEEHALVFVVHHSVCDGPSLEVIRQEFFQLYQGLGLPPPPVPPAAEAVDLDEAREYWRGELEGAPAVLDLPLDRPRPARTSSRGRRHNVELPTTLLDGVRTAARESRTSVFIVVLTALAAVLSRYAAEDEVVIGAPVSEWGERERAVGMFVNTLAFRADLRGNPTLAEALVRVRRKVLRGVGHRAVPFDEVVELVREVRDARHHPVFQVMLVVDTPPAGAPEGPPGLTVTSWELAPAVARFDLTVVATMGESEGRLALDYAADLFDEATAVRLAHDLVAALTVVTTATETRVRDIPLPSVARADAEVPPFDYRPAHELVAAMAAADPAAPAVVTTDGTLDYATVDRRANRLAWRLCERGVGAETSVGVALPAGADAVVAILGVLKAGGAYVPLDPAQPPARLAAMLADTGAWLVVGGAVPGCESVALDGGEAASPPGTTCPPQRLAYTVFTSGSTGRPKGVAVTHGTLARLSAEFRRAHGCFTAGQRVLMLPPLTFDASVGDLFPALTGGAALVLHPDPAALGGGALVSFCAEYGVTAVDAAAPQWRQWTEDLRGTHAPGTWPVTTMMVGGERVPVETLREWARVTGGRVAFHNHYGPTEATVCATVHTTVDGSECGETPYLPIGHPLPHVRVHVLDPHGVRVPPGGRGELYLGGDCLARGYVGAPARTADRFLPDPAASSPGARVYRTGDLVRQRADGTLEFLGRADRQIKLRGRRIEPGEIEAALTAHPSVRETVVVVRDDLPGGADLVAYHVPAGPSAGELRAFLRTSLPDYLIPRTFVELDKLPLTTHGKVDEHALPAPGRDALSRGHAEPEGEVEIALAAVWARALGVERVGRHDGFFDLGGHSLLAASVAAEAERALGVSVPVRAVFDAPDLAGLAAAVAGGEPVRETVDLDAETALPDDLRVRGARTGPPVHILLTGATGYLGAHLLAELLATSRVRVRCLVRAASPEAATARLTETLLRHGLKGDAHRVEAVPGDLTRPGLGLDAERYASLAEESDLICHAARLVDFVRPYGRLRPVNVGGVLEILRLATTGTATPVHLVSTLGVFLGSTGTVTESATPAPPAGAYYLSRWVAERLAVAARERGLPVSIHRPARIGGHSRTGRWHTGDHFSRMLVGYAQLGLVPELEHEEDLVPVDHVAAAVARLALDGVRADLHYVNHATVTYGEIAAALAEAGSAVEQVPWPTWIARARARADEGGEFAVTPLLSTLPDDPPDPGRPSFDCSATESALAEAGIPAPPHARDLVRAYAAFLVGGRAGSAG
ncbi:amino acid adenylation domain-containing protein [Nonomuraea endophytica]|uniref:amino acid adenylation domain-containing protein n=1 Tax=Nonomuraea endophytica TaxID=714136 RepID=UPI0037C6F8F0